MRRAYSQRAILMTPGDPAAHVSISAIAHAHMGLASYEKAWMLIAANALLGRMEEAKRWLAKFRALLPDSTIARIRDGQPHKDPRAMAAIFEGLRLAGLEEG
jgi:adenylate cyclase